MSQLDITIIDTGNLKYENELLRLTVLGGIRLDGLDRMRVTLKIELLENPRPPVRHNLDLYNDTQTEKLVRKCAEKLEIGTSIIAASLSHLTEQLENYRLQQLKEQQQNEINKPKHLSEEQIKAAIQFLLQPDLLQRTNELIGKSGVVGEELNRLLMYIIFTSRKREQPLHIISLGSSGTGKTHLQEKVGELIPEEDKIEITTLSENAFYYFGQRELKHKLILIEDLDGAENVLYPMRELMTKRHISKTIAHKNTKGETRTIHLIVEGPVSVAGCTTQEFIYEDNANRSFLIYLDESKEQDAKVMEYQRKLSAGKINTDEENQIKELFKNCQRLLEPMKIINPYAEHLHIPEETLKPRRTNHHYLQFIEAITFYKQHQREKKADTETGEIYIETSLEDIADANELIKEILLRKSDELTGACRNYFERLKAYISERDKSNASPVGGSQKGVFTNREIRKALRIHTSNQKRYNIALFEGYYIRRIKGTKARGYEYQITSYQEFTELQNKITDVLDETIHKIKAGFNGSAAAQKQNEPLKRKRAKVLQEQTTTT